MYTASMDISKQIYVCLHPSMHLCMYVCVCVWMYIYMVVCMYVCMHICVCVCNCIFRLLCYPRTTFLACTPPFVFSLRRDINARFVERVGPEMDFQSSSGGRMRSSSGACTGTGKGTWQTASSWKHGPLWGMFFSKYLRSNLIRKAGLRGRVSLCVCVYVCMYLSACICMYVCSIYLSVYFLNNLSVYEFNFLDQVSRIFSTTALTGCPGLCAHVFATIVQKKRSARTQAAPKRPIVMEAFAGWLFIQAGYKMCMFWSNDAWAQAGANLLCCCAAKHSMKASDHGHCK